MRGYRDKIGGLRAGLLLGVSTAALLAGCDWFDGNTPVSSRQVRPGAERSVAVSASLPAAGTGRQYDTGLAAVDETRSGGAQIGSIVAGKGGQKAQQEALAKAALETDRKARADMERQIAQRKEEDAKVAAASKSAGVTSTPAASEAATQAAPPPPAPVVTSTAMPPPAETAAAAAPAQPAPPPVQPAAPPVATPASASVAVAATPTPTRPVDPNKAFEPPPGWVPPGQTAPVVTDGAPPATAVATAQPVASTAPAVTAAPLPPVAGTSAAPAPARSTANSSTVATSTTLLPSPAETATPVAQPAAPVAVASAPARRVDPNKAFEPPPGWTPPGQSTPSVQTAAAAPPPAVVPAPAPAPSPAAGGMTTSTTLLPTSTPPASTPPASTQVATSALPPTAEPASTPAPTMPVRSATPRYGVGETDMPSTPADRPGFARPADVAAAAPPPPLPIAASPAATPPATPSVTVTATPPAAPVDLQADISRARSGEVPSTAIKSPPGGPLQVAVIQFGRASSGLGGRDSEILRSVAQIQKKNGGTVRVVAHAEQDVTGASVSQIEQGNYDVSRRRAINIANRLMALGVPRSAIVAEAASDSEPKYATNTARGIAANRRAEIFLDL